METIEHPDLPLCIRFKVEWHWFWFGYVWEALTGTWGCRWDGLGYMRTRGANFSQVWIGPVSIIWREPWLAGSARSLHPELFKE